MLAWGLGSGIWDMRGREGGGGHIRVIVVVMVVGDDDDDDDITLQ